MTARSAPSRAAAVVAAIAVWGGCAYTHPPVPVLADGPAVGAALAGVWEGTYESRETGRMGDLYFALSADADSAVGEVVMAPRGAVVEVRRADEAWRWEGVARAQVLTIQFVHLRDGEVVGELDPYRDPECGCSLRTTFRGDVEGDTIFGTFESTAEHPAHDADGTWHAVRRRAP